MRISGLGFSGAKGGARGSGHEFQELDSYLKTLPRYTPLTREEERALAFRARKGDSQAREELIKRNLPFVVAIAKRCAGRGARLDDLIQEGNLGLLRAVEKFDTKKGTRFSTYAIWWIRAYVQKYLKEVHSMVRGGEDKQRRGLRDVSLDESLDEEGDTTALERLADDGPGPDLRYATGQSASHIRAQLLAAKGRLGPLGWEIVQQRLEADEPQTLEQIGRRWGVSRERVRQVELKTRGLLRRALSDWEEAA